MNIFIGGSAKENIAKKYMKEGEKIAEYIIHTNHNIICCADERGIVGQIYRKMKEKNESQIILTIPKIYERYAKTIDTKIDILTNTINERTDKSIQESDVCLFLPGGIGTIYEILSCIETKRAGEHDNEILIINSYGFYNYLFEMLDKLYEGKFAEISDKQTYHVFENSEETIEYLKKLEKKK